MIVWANREDLEKEYVTKKMGILYKDVNIHRNPNTKYYTTMYLVR